MQMVAGRPGAGFGRCGRSERGAPVAAAPSREGTLRATCALCKVGWVSPPSTVSATPAGCQQFSCTAPELSGLVCKAMTSPGPASPVRSSIMPRINNQFHSVADSVKNQMNVALFLPMGGVSLPTTACRPRPRR